MLQQALLAYTLEHGHPRFLHQHAVDSLGAQHADVARVAAMHGAAILVRQRSLSVARFVISATHA